MKKGGTLLVFALLLVLTQVSANLAPQIGELDTEFIICEGTSFSETFIAKDPEGASLTSDISPKIPFHTRVISTDPQKTIVEIYSTNITKNFSNQVFESIVSVSDEEFVDSRKITFKTFETNNKPIISPIGATTISLERSKNLLKQISVSDVESGDEKAGELTFLVTSETLNLTVNDQGVINGSFRSEDIGLHEVKICVTDSGVEDIQEKIGFCGGSEVKETSCSTFQLSITQSNSAPTILEFNSTNQSTRFPGNTPLTFEVTKFDPDEIIPDTLWYVDNQLVRKDIGKTRDIFTYEFGCGIWGKHKIRAEVTDGLDTDSIEWNFDIIRVNCAEGELPGGIIGLQECRENLACGDWNLCQNAAQSEELGYISSADLKNIEKQCTQNNWSEDSCGFQIRECTDINQCSLTNNIQFQSCYFSLNPTCSDGIKNCHSGSCETLIDCGGPCQTCPTCSDGKQNQGEAYIDCGGPCSEECPTVIVSPEEKKIKIIILIAIGVLILIAAALIFFIMHEKRKLEEPPTRGKPVQKPQITQQNAQN